MVLARFIIGFVFILGSIFFFLRDPLTVGWIIAGIFLGVIGLACWGLWGAIGEIGDAID